MNVEPFVQKHRLLLVSIAKTYGTVSDYDATRYAWRVAPQRAKKVDLVLGCVKGVVKGVFVASRWLDASPGEATKRNFPKLVPTHKNRRFGFEGAVARKEEEDNYLNKCVPDDFRIGQNGFRYMDLAA